jgi:hypothetical protein
VITVYLKHRRASIINRALMTFAYRKTMKHLRLEIGHHVVVGKTLTSHVTKGFARPTRLIVMHRTRINAIVSKTHD